MILKTKDQKLLFKELLKILASHGAVHIFIEELFKSNDTWRYSPHTYSPGWIRDPKVKTLKSHGKFFGIYFRYHLEHFIELELIENAFNWYEVHGGDEAFRRGIPWETVNADWIKKLTELGYVDQDDEEDYDD